MKSILEQMKAESSSVVEKPAMISTSSIFHKAPGFCPKCHAPMTTAKNHLDDTLHFCTNCKVSCPMPNTGA